ncbi:MAG: trypsin-like peptidase domain-containing protein [Lachnospiraceae bacterium]|nr:trypsin-like peptidase domain-containing protein [Lachnospiraceae bacterium]
MMRRNEENGSKSRSTVLSAAALILSSVIAVTQIAGSAYSVIAEETATAAADSETQSEVPTSSALPLPGETQTQSESLPTIADSTAEPVTFAQTANEELQNTSAVTGLPDVSDVVAQCEPSVVLITHLIETTTTGSNGLGWFFGESSGSSTREEEASGSGVIIGNNEEELLIVTNNHVAVVDSSGTSSYYQYSTSTSKGLTVTFTDGSEHEANLKGADAEMDLAVIAVDLADLSEETKASIRVATIGDSTGAKPGQGVIAIGNSMGMGMTTTIGYISALNRDVTTSDGYTRSLMQVDAAINSGNSGGGLFNGNGELIGINSAKYMSVGVEGIGYAIPISSAKEIIDELKEQKTKVSLPTDARGYLGVVGEDVSSTRVQYYGFPAGAQLMQINAGSPAEAAGLQINDIVTAVNDQEITSYDEMRTALSYYAPGETVTLTIQRIVGNHFEEMKIEVTLSTREAVLS